MPVETATRRLAWLAVLVLATTACKDPTFERVVATDYGYFSSEIARRTDAYVIKTDRDGNHTTPEASGSEGVRIASAP